MGVWCMSCAVYGSCFILLSSSTLSCWVGFASRTVSSVMLSAMFQYLLCRYNSLQQKSPSQPYTTVHWQGVCVAACIYNLVGVVTPTMYQ